MDTTQPNEGARNGLAQTLLSYSSTDLWQETGALTNLRAIATPHGALFLVTRGWALNKPTHERKANLNGKALRSHAGKN